MFDRTAPEALKTTRFTVQSDVWSFGVTLWEMFSHGALPWGELNAVQVGYLMCQTLGCALCHC